MKHHPVATANAAAVTAAIVYVVCLGLFIVAPELGMGIAKSWVHGLDLAKIAIAPSLNLVSLVWGIVTVSGATWLVGYLFASLYNAFLQK
ncbi:MAG: hypothetical protein UV61_C0009G0040 [Candidatus Gottesmanbacteria bacterium GW2011_GWB1_43_11]|uniref:Uncharacterized protein n=1 Tax=Candidatus Gottesmanbacteria bacterium GW2011_GWB1_43_11 TaxID=1618446 RepID=A0A0G1FI34_9BACT|nr:MAG: hypothetical protein UV17_C0031G0011 [Candidatus Gottesmanbacteria bacterium GW2011_GWA1_42_26]KKS81394.1 MAG: hypothetical protein UV55_C0015G0040 [Candidatus Gottesmanbacteria bacterium GW2011_GWC1_43_10]KKS86513.1 MAG: hypothetical protein UV61_C0009G0040 [Candidatus Gottesmanbacteria bacterium GW2011_GWB1_43_11]OGG07470.1 MAG: hypothetical protein A2699_03085 [Candidatus Gottesmanbacteria bacterium RIFCSPHIGHO2_01_FULL_43_15]OGG26516.1 MAG: hypothetical protein A3A59_06180 [Candidat